MNTVKTVHLLEKAAATVVGAVFSGPVGESRNVTFQASIDGTGSVSATIEIQGSNDGAHWILLATITLSGTDTDTDGFPSSASWAMHRAELTAIAGTNAKVNVDMGV